MSERVGILAAILSSRLGGMAAGATRFATGAADAITPGAFRFGLGL